jgi:translation initiation factor 1
MTDIVEPLAPLNLGGFDPLADVDGVGAGAPEEASDDAVHIRVQQRNGRKSLTTVQGVKEK